MSTKIEPPTISTDPIMELDPRETITMLGEYSSNVFLAFKRIGIVEGMTMLASNYLASDLQLLLDNQSQMVPATRVKSGKTIQNRLEKNPGREMFFRVEDKTMAEIAIKNSLPTLSKVFKDITEQDVLMTIKAYDLRNEQNHINAAKHCRAKDEVAFKAAIEDDKMKLGTIPSYLWHDSVSWPKIMDYWGEWGLRRDELNSIIDSPKAKDKLTDPKDTKGISEWDGAADEPDPLPPKKAKKASAGADDGTRRKRAYDDAITRASKRLKLSFEDKEFSTDDFEKAARKASGSMADIIKSEMTKAEMRSRKKREEERKAGREEEEEKEKELSIVGNKGKGEEKE